MKNTLGICALALSLLAINGCDRFRSGGVPDCGDCGDDGGYGVNPAPALRERGELPLDLKFSGEVTTRAVFAADDREPMPLDMYPWSAVGRLVTSEGHCTASLIGPDLILTNAHCVMMGDENSPTLALPQAVRFYPAFHPGQPAMHSSGLRVWLDDLVLERGLVNVSGQLADWAIIRLRQPLGDRYGWLSVGQASNVDAVSLGGYSGDHQDGEVALVHRDCHVTEQRPDGSMIHDCDMTAGASGSPLIRWDGREAQVVALNAMEAGDRKTGSRYQTGVAFSEHAYNVAVSSASFARQLPHISPLAAGQRDFYITYCNDLDESAALMLAHLEEDGVMSFGPYQLGAGACQEVHMGNRQDADFFVSLQTSRQQVSGDQMICVQPGEAISSALGAACERGQESLNFAAMAQPEKGHPLLLSSIPTQARESESVRRKGDSGKSGADKKGGTEKKRKGKERPQDKGERSGPNVLR